LAHQRSAPRLQAVLRAQGGYFLHVDGTGEGGGPRGSSAAWIRCRRSCWAM
jgi:hypothetical protein